MFWVGSLWFGLVWFGLVRVGSVLVRFGSVRFGSVRFGSVRFGLVWSIFRFPLVECFNRGWFGSAGFRLSLLGLQGGFIKITSFWFGVWFTSTC